MEQRKVSACCLHDLVFQGAAVVYLFAYDACLLPRLCAVYELEYRGAAVACCFASAACQC